MSKDFVVQRNFFGRARARHEAVSRVSLSVGRGETLGLVGESGCGKSTLARLLLRLLPPSSGSVYFDGQEITSLATRRLRPIRKRMQVVFQDPYTALNPRLTVGASLAEALPRKGQEVVADKAERIAILLERVGLKGSSQRRYPHEFSGGQLQRIGIARALAREPELIIADEPVSALDVSVQAQVINLMMDLQEELGLSFLFISHDLSVVRHISQRVAVMHCGKIVETGPTEELFRSPQHGYTRRLLKAAPRLHSTQ